jgi:hypothetical protein
MASAPKSPTPTATFFDVVKNFANIGNLTSHEKLEVTALLNEMRARIRNARRDNPRMRDKDFHAGPLVPIFRDSVRDAVQLRERVLRRREREGTGDELKMGAWVARSVLKHRGQGKREVDDREEEHEWDEGDAKRLEEDFERAMGEELAVDVEDGEGVEKCEGEGEGEGVGVSD